jgi:hypothetical protein
MRTREGAAGRSGSAQGRQHPRRNPPLTLTVFADFFGASLQRDRVSPSEECCFPALRGLDSRRPALPIAPPCFGINANLRVEESNGLYPNCVLPNTEIYDILDP